MSELDEALRVLESGGVIGLPTETVYGLAADGLNPAAVARIFAIKGRPTAHPLILHLAGPSELGRYVAHVPESAARLAARFWPGPLTLILERSALVPDAVTGGLSTVAVRVPSHPVAREVLRRFGRPLAAPSANRFGGVSPTTREHVLADLGADVPLVLEGGPSEVGLESTIIDLSRSEPRLLRPGRVSKEELAEVLGASVLLDDGTGPAAPGTLESHYAPRAPVVLCREEDIWREAERRPERSVGVLTSAVPPAALPARLVVVSLGGTLERAAKALYGGLRELDASGVEVIVSSVPTLEPAGGLAEAIADRLARASAPRPAP